MDDKVDILEEDARRGITVIITPLGMPGPEGKSQAIRTYTEDGITYMQTGTVVPPATEPVEWSEPFRVTGPEGPRGFSAYEVAVNNGFEGTESEWLESLIGPQGISAYEIAVANGFEGSVSEWLLSLVGEQGPQGVKGDKGDTGDMPIEALNEFLGNFYDPSIVALNARAENIERKLRFVQDELDNLEPKPELYMASAATSVGKLHTVLPEDGSGDFTVERNSEATYIDKDGLIKTAAPNVPRIDWSTGEPMLLRESESINLIPFSEDFTNWDTYGSLITSNASESPDGSFTASMYEFQGADFLSSPSIPIISGQRYTLSVWVKGTPEVGEFHLGMSSGDLWEGEQREQFILSENWTRLSFTLTAIADGSSNARLRINFNSGVTEGQYVYIWGAQLEEGSKATSYIPTNGAIATRLPDYIYTADATGLIGQSAGTVFIELEDFGKEYAAAVRVFEINSSSSANRILFSKESVGGGRFRIYIGSDGNASVSIRDIYPGTLHNKIAFKYYSNKFDVFINGGKILTGGTFQPPTSPYSHIGLGSRAENNSAHIDALIKSFALYKEALSDSQLIEMTTL